ncbi:NAD(P)/FAD-dependent oxidoreductase [Paraburkholderia caribensis]|uniref:NADH:ubiquinone reductase (non-electrogenic) n=2 Tax=Paraburkholderia caribensis TaxID=75105 RepID=A0ABV0E1T5_9BURK|nr:NAD(P)/FAD-dependent oxidoreductase [Paraburkholderia caribensis]MCO4879685.1 NAD(P)/FAD-dependent oxidoreductase [Paraburkholderia caribensis]PTB26717.1 NAD(P)/FAD-dependent oxidoreductase [Paraburkholderia caribensis]
MEAEKNIVVIGGGFAGTTVAQALEKRLPAPYRVVLVSDESFTTFNPMLAEVVGASVFPEQVIVPIRQILRHSRFIMATVQDVDYERKIVHGMTLAGPREIDFEHLIFAFGTRANLELVPGMKEHALPLKLVGDAMFVRNQVLRRLACIELESDPAVRLRLGHFIVVGGGFSGVEVAGELADYLHSIRHFYKLVRDEELAVTILHDGSRLLPEMPEALGVMAAQRMADRGINIRLGARASHVSSEGVVLQDGQFIEGATVICTIGTRSNPLIERLATHIGLPVERGKISTQSDMSVPGLPALWAAGDCALVHNAATGQPSPPTAQHAVAQAHQLAENLVRRLAGKETHAFSFVAKGMMATIGHMKGVASIYGIRLTGLPAWLLWRAFYLSRVPTLGRKLRIFVEWSWSMFFPTDITHLRFTRSSEAEDINGHVPRSGKPSDNKGRTNAFVRAAPVTSDATPHVGASIRNHPSR